LEGKAIGSAIDFGVISDEWTENVGFPIMLLGKLSGNTGL
jgi:hypothetical protein